MIYVYFDDLIFQNKIWNISKLFRTALLWAILNEEHNTVKLFLRPDIINELRNIYLIFLMYFTIF